MKGKRLVVNTIFMTLTSVILRLGALAFQVFLSRRLGAAGIGLFQLVMSVNSFAATLAISGIRFATTRLVSEEIGRGRTEGVAAAVKKCLTYAFSCGAATTILMNLAAEYVGTVFIGDARTVLSLRILGLSMPFLSAGAALSGYFTGVCRVGQSAVAAISEQVFKIVVSVILLGFVPQGNVELTCAAVVLGNVTGEILSFFVIYVLYRLDRRKYMPAKGRETRGITARMFGIAVPLALAAYARMALNTVQNVLIPKGFSRSGASRETALADYGKIQGMVFPVITFPSVIFTSVSELIVPELTEEQVKGRDRRISEAANLLLKLCLVFSLGVMGALYSFSGELGRIIYKSDEVGDYIKLFSFLMPIMYMDNVTDGMLRGLGQHLYSMRINIIDSLLCTFLIWFLLPRYAIYGYIFILYASEIFNFSLSLYKLSRITRLNSVGCDILKSAFALAGAVSVMSIASRLGAVRENALSLTAEIILFEAVYLAVAVLLGVFEDREISVLKAAVK